MMSKKAKREEQCYDYDYFQNLPDELLTIIFTKISRGDGDDTLTDIKLLCQCSTLSKRFSSLITLLPALSITHPSITAIYKSCPKILKKFKHIRSLHLKYQSNLTQVVSDINNLPFILSKPRLGFSCQESDPELPNLTNSYIYSKATYKSLHTYSLAVLTCTDVQVYSQESREKPYVWHSSPLCHDDIVFTRCYISYLFNLHHMLFSSIRDHKLLQTVVVTDFTGRESFSLLEEQLVELRSNTITGTANLAQSEGCLRSGFFDMFTIALSDNEELVLKDVSFSSFTKWEKSTFTFDKCTGSTRPDYDVPQLEGPGKLLQGAFETLLGAKRDYLVEFKDVKENNWL